MYLRLGEAPQRVDIQPILPTALACALPIFLASGLYRVIFRYSSWPALAMVLRAVAISSIPFIAIVTMIGVPGVPRTIGIIHPLLLVLLISASRAIAHALLAQPYGEARREWRRARVLIYGAGSAGLQLLAGLKQTQEFSVVGFLDDDRMLIGQRLHGLPVHDPKNLEEIQKKLAVTDVLLALPNVTRARRAQIIAALQKLPVRVRTIPGMTDIALGKIALTDIRELDVNDLLGRCAVPPDSALLSCNVTGKTLLVTGAGGSIGSELCRQLIHLKPARLLLVENSEYALYAIHMELAARVRELSAAVDIVPALGSVTDRARMTALFEQYGPDGVFHAAAYKHVPMVESNPIEGLKNNVFGTLITAQVAIHAGVRNFVLISTDKAVRPTNIMGATKRLAEMALQALAAETTETCMAMVRFGNVLGSSGSVVPLFRRQIKEGGPVTITHPEVIRYFMTIPEAAQLVVQAGAMAEGGEVFVLDMGEPVKIIDLARNMIELSGLTVRDDARPDGDIELKIVGLRPGEKLYEELLIGEDPQTTSHSRILKANEKYLHPAHLFPALDNLWREIEAQDETSAIAILQELVPEFSRNQNNLPTSSENAAAAA